MLYILQANEGAKMVGIVASVIHPSERCLAIAWKRRLVNGYFEKEVS